MLCREPDRILTPEATGPGGGRLRGDLPHARGHPLRLAHPRGPSAGLGGERGAHRAHRARRPGCCRRPGRCGSRPGCRTRPPPRAAPPCARCTSGPGFPRSAGPQPTPVAASPLLAELIGYLGEPGLPAGHRAHAEVAAGRPADAGAGDHDRGPAAVRADRPAGGRRAARRPRGPAHAARVGPRRWARASGRWPARSRRRRACRSAAGGPCCGCRPRCPCSRPASRSAGWRAGSATTPRARSWPRSAARPARPPGRSSEP